MWEKQIETRLMLEDVQTIRSDIGVGRHSSTNGEFIITARETIKKFRVYVITVY